MVDRHVDDQRVRHLFAKAAEVGAAGKVDQHLAWGANASGAQGIAKGLDFGPVSVVLRHHHDATCAADDLDGSQTGLPGVGERLLRQHVAAGFHRLDGDFLVRLGRCDDQDGVRLELRESLVQVEIALGRRDPKLVLDLFKWSGLMST